MLWLEDVGVSWSEIIAAALLHFCFKLGKKNTYLAAKKKSSILLIRSVFMIQSEDDYSTKGKKTS